MKIATHFRFDEGMNDLPIESTPPNIQHITRIQGDRLPEDSREMSKYDLQFFELNFRAILVVLKHDSYQALFAYIRRDRAGSGAEGMQRVRRRL